jgi:hypothetical protein
MGAGASSMNADDVAAMAKQPVAYELPLGPARTVRGRATATRARMDAIALTWRRCRRAARGD